MNRPINGEFFAEVVQGVWSDLSSPGVALQVGVLVVCLVVGWSISRALRNVMRDRQVNFKVVRFGVESVFRVVSPLIALGLILTAKPILAQYQQVRLLKLAVPLLVSFALVRLVFYLFRRIFARSGHASPMLLLVEKLVAVGVWIGYALYITGLLPELEHFLERIILPIGRYKISLLDVVQAGVSVAITVVLAMWAGALFEERLMRMESMHSSLRIVAARLVRALLISAALLLSLSLVGIDLTILSVFGGALGVGIGLGLQKIIGSYVSGFVILLERSLSVGDIVTVDKYHGRVTRINPRYTVIRSPDGIENVMPNDMLISGTVQNYSLTDRSLRLAAQITIGYASNLEPVLTLLQQTAADVPRVLKETPPSVTLLKVSADGLELEVGFWIADPENGRLNVISDVNRAIWQMLKAHNIPVPFNQKDINIMQPATLAETMPERNS